MARDSFTKKELALIKKLDTPARVQDYLNRLRFNFEEAGETLRSPLRVMRTRAAHCLEGAIFAAFVFARHGRAPLVLHLEAERGDFDHVVAPFKQNGRWGAVSKTNHAVLRYREPVYASVRELVMSYFHEYFLNGTGRKTLRRYSRPFDLRTVRPGWQAAPEDLWRIDRALDAVRHYGIVPKSAQKTLRPADRVEREAGRIVEYRKGKK